MTVGERIKQRRLELNMTVDEVAAKLGKNRATVYRYESNDIENLPTAVLVPLAKVLETTPAELMGWQGKTKEIVISSDVKKGVRKVIDNAMSEAGLSYSKVIPVYSRVAAGIPLEASGEIVDAEEIPVALARTGDYFGLRVQGDSMEPKISNGDTVIVRKQEDAESGELVVVLVNGHDATLKKLKKLQNGIMLISSNPAYDPIIYTAEDVKTLPVQIVGKVVELRAKL